MLKSVLPLVLAVTCIASSVDADLDCGDRRSGTVGRLDGRCPNTCFVFSQICN
jgi:hypothetical protein